MANEQSYDDRVSALKHVRALAVNSGDKAGVRDIDGTLARLAKERRHVEAAEERSSAGQSKVEHPQGRSSTPPARSTTAPKK